MRADHARVLLLVAGPGLLVLALGRTPTPPAVPVPAPVTGVVLGPHGVPLSGARVRYPATDVLGFTDDLGRFTLPPHASARRITAWKDGFLIGGTRLGRRPQIRLEAIPDEDDPNYAWVDPRRGPGEHNCANCHGEMFREWSASAHSRSVTGRHFVSLYRGTDWHGKPDTGWGLLREHPNGAGVCASCHAPTLRDDDPALLEDITRAVGVAALGVHCDFCHKITDVGTGTPGLAHGRFDLVLRRPAKGQLFFGPLDDVDRGEDAYAPLYRDSRYCASCHEGTVFGVHVYGTYSEWLASDARRQGRHCQDCHMAPTGKMTNVAPGRGGLERDPATLANHRFFAGSQAEMLQRSLKAEVLAGEGGTVRVSLEARDVGHRVPTGFIDRQLLLRIEGRDAAGRPLRPLSGPTLPPEAGEGWAGQPGRLYAKLLVDPEGKGPIPFWRPAGLPRDNRLHPGRPDVLAFAFPPALHSVRVVVVHRRFWREVARAKDWPDDDLVVIDQQQGVGSRE